MGAVHVGDVGLVLGEREDTGTWALGGGSLPPGGRDSSDVGSLQSLLVLSFPSSLGTRVLTPTPFLLQFAVHAPLSTAHPLA